MRATPPTPRFCFLGIEAAFGKSEISYLIEQPKFRAAMVKTIAVDDFNLLCDVAENLLGRENALIRKRNYFVQRTDILPNPRLYPELTCGVA